MSAFPSSPLSIHPQEAFEQLSEPGNDPVHRLRFGQGNFQVGFPRGLVPADYSLQGFLKGRAPLSVIARLPRGKRLRADSTVDRDIFAVLDLMRRRSPSFNRSVSVTLPQADRPFKTIGFSFLHGVEFITSNVAGFNG
jgi:hypothetical protein